MNKSPATETGFDFAHDYAIRGMLNIGELKNYCYQNKISIRQQYALVKRNYLEVYDLDYCKELFKFMKELKAVLDSCLDEEAGEKPPQSDVVKPSSEVPAKNAPEPPQPLQIGHFQLTETGRKIEPHTWNEMVASMVNLMHLPDEAREDWLYLLGVASEHKRTKPLDHKVVFNSSIMTLTTTPNQLTDGMETGLRWMRVIHVPVHELAMMMSIALRFIPILIDEANRIMNAQISRGSDFSSGGPVRRAKALIPLLVPLFVSAFRRANDLALAMEARGYHGGEGRTKMKPLVYHRRDHIAYGLIALYLAAQILIWKYIDISIPFLS
jgi:hypothetical protein